MSQKWKETAKYEPLANFMNNITYGFTNPMPDTEEGPWKVTAKDIVDGRINYQTARKTSRDAYEALTDKSRPKIGDVLLTKDGTLGRTALVEDADICINQSVAAIRCNDRIIPEFLVSLLQMPEYQERMLADAGGVTVKHLYITRVDKMPVLVPELDAQREWIAFIDQSDKSKFSGFKSQFIEMFGDPVENKNGWIKLTVKEAVDQGYIARPLDGNHGAKHPKGDDYVEVGVPFIMAQDLKNKQVDFESCHFITEKQASTLKKGWAKTGDVLLTNKGTIGRVAIVQLSKYEDMLLTPQITYYRCLRDIDNEYLAAYFGTGFFVDQLEKLTTGTTRASVTITQQEKLELIIPPKPMQRKFAEFVSQSDKSKLIAS